WLGPGAARSVDRLETRSRRPDAAGVDLCDARIDDVGNHDEPLLPARDDVDAGPGRFEQRAASGSGGGDAMAGSVVDLRVRERDLDSTEASGCDPDAFGEPAQSRSHEHREPRLQGEIRVPQRETDGDPSRPRAARND